ncbi:metallophosphoesterase [Vaginella massiliensis]|uniref:metallophosphoesterase n=1 Tax=Vaginella massiliensis TaxID=1816680 RepID=UPI003753A290
MKNRKNQLSVFKTLSIPLLTTFLISSCATYSVQKGKDATTIVQPQNRGLIQSFYLFGDTEKLESNAERVASVEKILAQHPAQASVIWLGNNADVSLLSKLKKTSEIPFYITNGDKEWQEGLENLQQITQQYQQTKLHVLSSNYCGIEPIELNENLVLLSIDSQWFLEGWEKNPNANADCPIQTRELFFKEFENQLNVYENRTVLLVMHHPILSNGKFGGQFSLKDQLFPFEPPVPLPVIGSALNLVRATSGISNQDLNNHFYRDLRQRFSTLLANRENVVVVSSHENSLQYVQQNGVKQIISGSLNKHKEAKASGRHVFSFGGNGFAKLNVFADGSSDVEFYRIDDLDTPIHRQQITPKRKEYLAKVYDQSIPKAHSSSIYEKDKTEKSKTYRSFFGEHYRAIYGENVKANTLDLEKHQLSTISEKEDLQFNSLKLKNLAGEEFSMIPVKKNPTQLIQKLAYKNDYVAQEFENTFTQKFLQDFQTTQHPFYPLSISEFTKDKKINQLASNLFYIPKQEALKEYNDDFGDELYLVQQLPKSSDRNHSYLTTEEMLAAIVQSKHHRVDRAQYIRLRLLDMLVGDWNRNESQWLWQVKVEGQDTIYTPYSATREFAFPKYDGAFFWFLMKLIPFRHMESYSESISNIKWFNKIAYPLDLAILENSTEEEWTTQAEYLQQEFNRTDFEKAFDILPNQNKSDDATIIDNLMKRKAELVTYAKNYHQVFDELVILKGSNLAERFTIDRYSNGKTKIVIADRATNEMLYEGDFDHKKTKEIRLYGLNGDDEFIEQGEAKNRILVRVIGGLGQDGYQISNYHKLKLYENLDNKGIGDQYKYDDYELNTYDYKNPKYNTLATLPNVGYNPDDGVKLGIITNYTINGFDRKPFSRRHQLQFNYFFATDAIEAKYKGTFVKLIGKWNVDLNAAYTSPTFSRNYFGMGNETQNHQKDLGMDFNRVRLQQISFGPSFYRIFKNEGRLDLFANYNHHQIEHNLDRIVASDPSVNPAVFDGQQFGELGASYFSEITTINRCRPWA